jgi:starch phosphorylase
LERLRELVYNVWWCWHPDAIELLRRIDTKVWEETNHNPVALLANVSQERLNYLASDVSFLDHLERVIDSAEEYLSEETWFERSNPSLRDCLIAYFSFEYGLTEAIPNYSGGLGVLSGDHVKSASDLGVPLVAVGLLYQEGYFRQHLSSDGWQQETYPDNDFYSLALQPMIGDEGEQTKISVPCLGEEVKCALWKLVVGRVNVLLLDANLPENSPRSRAITSRLYGGDHDMRIRQEIVLGIGGTTIFDKVPFRPSVFHMNEGHSAFLALERIRRTMEKQGCSFDEAREATSVSNVFTTHTPVPAGHDRFDPSLMMRYFEGYYQKLGLSADEFLALGREDPSNKSEPFCMTVLALNLSAARNGVAKLHGETSRRLWQHLWPSVPRHEVPIESVTNGIHTPSWISHDMAALFDRYLGRRWSQEPAEMSVWNTSDAIPDPELWRTHERRRERLVSFARRRLKAQLERRNAPSNEVAQAEEVLDPEILTIGFARRFATYKRATLLLKDPDRLIRLLTDPERPIQLMFAGKAHPNDSPGKDLIREIFHFAHRPNVRNRVVFLEDYDITTARYMVQGVDVWLNTPRRPHEASGTSGMKAAANGVLNCSTLDGWWDEAYTDEVGFAIGRGEVYDNLSYQDDAEANALFELLEKEIVPLFYDRGADGLPRRWIAMMQNAVRTIAPVFNTNRMVKEYTERFYLPGLRQGRVMCADDLQRAKELAEWKRDIKAAWGQIKVLSAGDDGDGEAVVGDQFGVKAEVDLASLKPTDVRVELYLGRIDPDDTISEAHLVEMACSNADDAEGPYQYAGRLPCRASGPFGYTLRILPSHPDLASPFDPVPIVWASSDAME